MWTMWIHVLPCTLSSLTFLILCYCTCAIICDLIILLNCSGWQFTSDLLSSIANSLNSTTSTGNVSVLSISFFQLLLICHLNIVLYVHSQVLPLSGNIRPFMKMGPVQKNRAIHNKINSKTTTYLWTMNKNLTPETLNFSMY